LYFRKVAESSDIDIFIYGLDSEREAIQRIFDIEAVIRKNQRLDGNTAVSFLSDNAITFVSPKWPYRHVQARRPRVDEPTIAYIVFTNNWR
jgi:hypothetical protein